MALALVAAAVSWMSPRQPDYVLGLEAYDADVEELTYMYRNLDWLGLSDDGLRQYESFRGYSVWSGVSRHGTDCLLIVRPDQGLGTGGCSTEGLQTIADLQKYSGVVDEAFADMPTGSIIRFVLKGDHVDVYLGFADPIESKD